MKTKFKQLLFLIIAFLLGVLSCEALFFRQQQEDPCYYEYIKGLRYDKNYSGRFVFCANRLMQGCEKELKYYFKHLPKEANFTSQEQIVVDKVKKIINDEFMENTEQQ